MLLCFIFDYSVTVTKSLLNNIHGGKFVFLERGLSYKRSTAFKVHPILKIIEARNILPEPGTLYWIPLIQ